MNCKPGDLAVIVHSHFADTIGMLCLVTSQYDIDEDGGWCWACRVSRAVSWEHEDTGEVVLGRNGMIPDSWLRPIRDSDGEDQMLRIAGKPQEVTA